MPICDNLSLVVGYDAFHAIDPWKIYDPDAPEFGNDLSRLHRGRGYWLNVTQSTTLVAGGLALRLLPGWNLIAWMD